MGIRKKFQIEYGKWFIFNNGRVNRHVLIIRSALFSWKNNKVTIWSHIRSIEEKYLMIRVLSTPKIHKKGIRLANFDIMAYHVGKLTLGHTVGKF